MAALGVLLQVVATIGGLLWWVTGFVTWFNNFSGLAKYLGLFFIPNLALPFFLEGADLLQAVVFWWGWLFGVGVLAAVGGMLTDEG